MFSARLNYSGSVRWKHRVNAGMDRPLGFVADLGLDIARRIAREIEYEWNSDPENDRFCR